MVFLWDCYLETGRNRIGTISYGEESPVAPNDTREGRQANRRVVLIVMS